MQLVFPYLICVVVAVLVCVVTVIVASCAFLLVFLDVFGIAVIVE